VTGELVAIELGGRSLRMPNLISAGLSLAVSADPLISTSVTPSKYPISPQLYWDPKEENNGYLTLVSS
jgi:hypothetical protein